MRRWDWLERDLEEKRVEVRLEFSGRMEGYAVPKFIPANTSFFCKTGGNR